MSNTSSEKLDSRLNKAVFSMTIYPNSILLVNANGFEAQTANIMRMILNKSFPGGSCQEFPDDFTTLFKLGNPSGNFFFTNTGKQACCHLLSKLTQEGWSVQATGTLDMASIDHPTGCCFVATTWFFERKYVVVEANGSSSEVSGADASA